MECILKNQMQHIYSIWVNLRPTSPAENDKNQAIKRFPHGLIRELFYNTEQNLLKRLIILPMANESNFIISKTPQIINHLNLLIKQKCLLTLKVSETESFLSAIIDIDAKKSLLFLDYGPKEYLNKKVLESNKIQILTFYQGIKVSFQGRQFKKAKQGGQQVFSMPLPDALFWLQRRQFYRVKSPLSKPSYLKLIRENEEPVNLQLYDISITGFSFLNESAELAPLFSPGNEFSECRLLLAENGEETIHFEIANVIALNPNKPDKAQKIGCKFMELPRTFESCVQRYMQQIEREARQR